MKKLQVTEWNKKEVRQGSDKEDTEKIPEGEKEKKKYNTSRCT